MAPPAPPLCPQCGYDLRQSDGRCPECGRPFTAADFEMPRIPHQRLAAAIRLGLGALSGAAAAGLVNAFVTGWSRGVEPLSLGMLGFLLEHCLLIPLLMLIVFWWLALPGAVALAGMVTYGLHSGRCGWIMAGEAIMAAAFFLLIHGSLQIDL